MVQSHWATSFIFILFFNFDNFTLLGVEYLPKLFTQTFDHVHVFARPNEQIRGVAWLLSAQT